MCSSAVHKLSLLEHMLMCVSMCYMPMFLSRYPVDFVVFFHIWKQCGYEVKPLRFYLIRCIRCMARNSILAGKSKEQSNLILNMEITSAICISCDFVSC